MRKINLIIKRVVDFFGSLIGMILISPLLMVIALSIKFTSKGPVFFVRERLGKDGKLFNMFKFRTMVDDAEHIGDGMFIKSERDERITSIGGILRATSLDELPQLFNVMIGEMSLVGPRPPVPCCPCAYEAYSEFQRRRFKMRPGITGLAQVTVRKSVGWDERIPIDIKYVNEFNIWLDVKILFKTVSQVFKKENIYENTDKNESKMDRYENL